MLQIVSSTRDPLAQSTSVQPSGKSVIKLLYTDQNCSLVQSEKIIPWSAKTCRTFLIGLFCPGRALLHILFGNEEHICGGSIINAIVLILYACVHAWMHAHMHICIYACMYQYTHAYVIAFVYNYSYIHARLQTCMHAYKYIYTFIYTYIYTYIHNQCHAYIHT